MSHPALAGAKAGVYWLDDPARPEPTPPLRGHRHGDLVVVGGGYAGLWSALRAVEREPGRDVVVLEAAQCGWQASGRNGGFCSASLTHGYANGVERWPDEIDTLQKMGARNLDEIEETLERYGINCGFERTGDLIVATQQHQLRDLADSVEELRAAGQDVRLLDAAQTRARIDSPTFLGAFFDPEETALVEPARLAWGLREACLRAGVRIFEQTPVTGVHTDGAGVEVTTRGGSVSARQVVLATNAFPSLLRRLRLMTVPVYDYVLMTEPLSRGQRDAIGWQGREGLSDSANLFHYSRLTRDGRILWGGYDAVYHFGSRIDPALEYDGRTHDLLAHQFFETFPQLDGLGFSHRWAGVIDTCTRFTAFYGTALGDRVAYALGFTGLGVGATRFAADVMLDLLSGHETERTALRMVREKPLPFPPEPLRAFGIGLTRRELERSDNNAGRRSLWLKGLDAAGLGFDS